MLISDKSSIKIDMSANWYPTKIRVTDEGSKVTLEFIQKVFKKNQSFRYAEFGFWKGATSIRVHELFPKCEIHLFDYHINIKEFKEKMSNKTNRFFFYGNSQKYNDSYNWNLMNLIKGNNFNTIYDYCYLDGAHTVAIDALNFFLVDKLLKVGGYIEFDDYNWSLRGSSLDPINIPEINDQYTDEQIDAKQVKMIVDILVKPNNSYKELVENRIFQKIS